MTISFIFVWGVEIFLAAYLTERYLRLNSSGMILDSQCRLSIGFVLKAPVASLIPALCIGLSNLRVLELPEP
jgi:hypothetical protein